MSEKVKKTGKFAIVLGVILAMVGVYVLMPQAKAAQISSRNVVISDPRPSQTGVSFDFQGNTTATTTRCIQMQFCTTATGTCTTPTGLSTTSATKVTTGWAVFNQSNWTLDNTTNGTLKLTFSTGENGGNGSSWVVGSITNPSSAGTYFVRVNTYSDSGCSTAIDSGVVAFAVVSGVSVSATVAETLTFSISDTAIGFGEMNTSNIRYATADETGSSSEPGNGQPSQLSVSTNANSGASITIQDTGNGTNAGLYSAGASKLIAATAPSGVSGGTESYAPYGKNASNLTIASGFQSNGSTAVTLAPQQFAYRNSAGSGSVDLAAKAGISTSTPAGSYSDTLILIATPTY